MKAKILKKIYTLRYHQAKRRDAFMSKIDTISKKYNQQLEKTAKEERLLIEQLNKLG